MILMTEYSYDWQDVFFGDLEERQFIQDVEYLREDRKDARTQYYEERSPQRRMGVDLPDEVPLYWIEMRGRQALIETFADSDDDTLVPNGNRPGNSTAEVIVNEPFNLFRRNLRDNHWFVAI